MQVDKIVKEAHTYEPRVERKFLGQFLHLMSVISPGYSLGKMMLPRGQS